MSNENVDELIDGRRAVYGDPKETFPRVAQIWSGILGFEVRADQVPLLLMGYKLARASECPEYSDNSDDIEGYLDIFRTVMGENLIKARTVDEFLQKRAAHQRKLEAAGHRARVATELSVGEQLLYDRTKWAAQIAHDLGEDQS